MMVWKDSKDSTVKLPSHERHASD